MNEKKYSLALDWTPNINHIGFFVANEKEFYKQNQISLEIQSPGLDNYRYSPAKKIEMGEVDFALCPTETVMSFRTKSKPLELSALATIFQEDISAIAVRDEASISRPADLDGKSYASYGARYEDLIVKQLIKNDGGEGDITISYPERLGVWDTILNGNFDATWIFMNWEGIEKPDFKLFKLKDYEIPYSYSPLIVSSKVLADKNEAEIKNFLAATKEGYMYSIKNMEESVEILQKFVPEKDRKIDLFKALQFSKDYFGNTDNFGKINRAILLNFFEWIRENGIEKEVIDVDELCPNFFV